MKNDGASKARKRLSMARLDMDAAKSRLNFDSINNITP